MNAETPSVAGRSDTSEHFSHGADIGIRGIGPTREAAFPQVALVLTSVITELKLVRPEGTVRIRCEEPTDDLLLVDWP